MKISLTVSELCTQMRSAEGQTDTQNLRYKIIPSPLFVAGHNKNVFSLCSKWAINLSHTKNTRWLSAVAWLSSFLTIVQEVAFCINGSCEYYVFYVFDEWLLVQKKKKKKM